jgi:hypothetical protein
MKKRPIALFLILSCLSSFAVDNSKTELSDEQKKEHLEKHLAEEKEVKAQFEYSLNDVSGKIVTVSCTGPRGGSSGSGFVAMLDGKPYLFTNQHVILGTDTIRFKTADGQTLRPRSVELSTTRDIARLLLADDTEGFEITDKVAIGSPIAVFGNSQGGGVATALYGKITAVASDVVEVSADFVAGNSGSPILNLNQEVIGIATYVRSYSNDEDGSKTRRFCYRLSGNEWKPVNWKKYNERYGKLYRKNEAIVDSVLEVAGTWYAAPFARMTADDHPDADLRKWSKEHNHMINRIMRLRDKGRCSQNELNNTNKLIKKDMQDSASALSAVCRKHARQIRMLTTQREFSGFLHNEFETFAARLDITAIEIDLFGKKLAKIDFFHFEKKDDPF